MWWRRSSLTDFVSRVARDSIPILDTQLFHGYSSGMLKIARGMMGGYWVSTESLWEWWAGIRCGYWGPIPVPVRKQLDFWVWVWFVCKTLSRRGWHCCNRFFRIDSKRRMKRDYQQGSFTSSTSHAKWKMGYHSDTDTIFQQYHTKSIGRHLKLLVTNVECRTCYCPCASLRARTRMTKTNRSAFFNSHQYSSNNARLPLLSTRLHPSTCKNCRFRQCAFGLLGLQLIMSFLYQKCTYLKLKGISTNHNDVIL